MPLKLPSFRARRDVYPPDLWTKCPTCSTMLFNKQLEKNLRVCTTCGHHFRLSAEARIGHLLDPGTWSERDAGLQSVDALGFVDQKPYPDRLAAAQLATGMRDAAVWGTGAMGGHDVAICVMDFGFMGGSMGAVVGEKVARAAEHALQERIPLVVVSASGGARMQEGTLALMQLAKTLAALERLRAGGVPFISVLSDPTTGGVFASFAAVGDVNIAEPDALIGFAGARVTAGTIAAELPPGFQRAEFLLSHGFVDRVVARHELHDELASLLRLLPPRGAEIEPEPDEEIPAFRPFSFLTTIADRVGELTNGEGQPPDAQADEPAPPVTVPAVALDGAVAIAAPDAAARDDVWARVQLARSLRRPRTLEFVEAMADEFFELHGDRLFGDDAAIVAGLARIGGRRVVVVGQQKGADTDENIRRNFGMPHPEGYRKAMRVMELAERVGLPIVTFVDVPGAHPGPESEERGIAEAIARSIGLMSRLRTPIVTVITGEGGSGGALAIAVGDRVNMLEYSIYSVIAPESCSAILWRDQEHAAAAAEALRLIPEDLKRFDLIDEIIPEPEGGGHNDHVTTARYLGLVLEAQLVELGKVATDALLEHRYEKFRAMGVFGQG